jgi:hypothetical protein
MRNHKRTSVSTRKPTKRRKTNHRPRRRTKAKPVRVIPDLENGETAEYLAPFWMIGPQHLTIRQRIEVWWSDLTDWQSVYGPALALFLLAVIFYGSFCHHQARPVQPTPTPTPVDTSRDPKYGAWTEPTPIPNPPTPIYTPNSIRKLPNGQTEYKWTKDRKNP